MDKQINELLDSARDVLKRTDVIDQLYALDTVLFAACPSDPALIATHTMNHTAFMLSLATTPAELDRVIALMDKVQQEIVANKRQVLAAVAALTPTVH